MPRYQGYKTDAASRRTRYDALKSSLWKERASFDSHWQELASFILPRRVQFQASDRNRGDKRNQNIINSTGEFALRTLSSGMHAGLTSPARPWMKLTTPDPQLAQRPHVKIWLHNVTKLMLEIFSQSNLYNILPIIYEDLGLFGTGAMSVLSDGEHGLFRAYQYPIGSYALALDRRGLVCTFVTEYELTVRQVVEEFGVQDNGTDIDWTTISRTVQDHWDKGNYEVAVPVTWVVTPNEYRNDDRILPKYLPYASCHYEANNEKAFLRESGFRTNPVLAPRWGVTGRDTYGTRCPGMTALGDVKQLQSEERNKGKAIAKQIDPPLVGPPSLRSMAVSMLPGGVTYSDDRDGMKGLRAIHDTNINLNDLRLDINGVEMRIQRAFYEDLFLLLARADDRGGVQPYTATEVDERREEKFLALGPVIERTGDELLDPLVDRTFDMMDAAGFFSEDVLPPPDELAGMRLRVEYESILVQAQRLTGVVGQDRLLQTAVPMVQAGLISRHKINGNRYINNLSDMLGVDPEILRSDEDADQMAQQEAQAAQMAEAAQQMETTASAVQKMGATPMQGDTALNRVLGGGGVASAAVGGPA